MRRGFKVIAGPRDLMKAGFRRITAAKDELKKLEENNDVLLINSSIAQSEEEILLAWALAEKAFREKTNIARKFRYEFLLWLTGKRDIRRAVEFSRPKGKEVIIVDFSHDKKILKSFRGKKMRKTATPLELERISLGRLD